jgi:hypothetical protein
LAHVNAHSLERQQQQAIDRSTQETHNALQLEEIKDELVCEIQLAMHGDERDRTICRYRISSGRPRV